MLDRVASEVLVPETPFNHPPSPNVAAGATVGAYRPSLPPFLRWKTVATFANRSAAQEPSLDDGPLGSSTRRGRPAGISQEGLIGLYSKALSLK